MAVKKSELYSLLWEACNKLRGGVEPARYKDYVLVLLFFKYVSDRYEGQRFAEFTINPGASFNDLIAAKGKSDVGERVDKIIQKFLEENGLQGSLPDVSFNNPDELGTGKELVDKVSGLIGVFQNPAIDFKSNRASGDDIIGDAYEYFMMKFAQESGKSKGQFYTPSEVSRIIARLIGIGNIKNDPNTKYTIYDPAAGSGSLLIRAADESPVDANGESIVTIYGQDESTSGLAKMNLILHHKGTGEIKKGNTLSDPKFLDEMGQLKKFDFVVMNPPFSDKDWTSGIKANDDKFHRFDGFGVPPEKNGDYTWFLHVLKSLNSTGKAGIVMPHGVLFRGNAEETIRKQILEHKWIKGIVGLPQNLFYGTGIPACIVIIDKEDADTREGIFMIDASNGYKKEGNKNRLREQDIEKIVRTFNGRIEEKGYSRFVSYDEITAEDKNNGNLNLPRYIAKIDTSLPQNIAAHLNGGIPAGDVDSLEKLWKVSADLKSMLFTEIDKQHEIYNLAVDSTTIEDTIYSDPDVAAEKEKEVGEAFTKWKNEVKDRLLTIEADTDPKTLIRSLAGDILADYEESVLLDHYDVYDCLLNYWNEKLQDDVYAIKAEGYEAGRDIEYEYAQKKSKDENGDTISVDDKSKLKSFEGSLIPRNIIEHEYFEQELQAITEKEDACGILEAELDEMREEESGEDGLLKDVLNESGDSIPKANLNKRIKELDGKKTSEDADLLLQMITLFAEGKTEDMEKLIKASKTILAYDIRNKNGTFGKGKLNAALKEAQASATLPDIYADEYAALVKYQEKTDELDAANKELKALHKALDEVVLKKYAELTIDEIKELLFERKWMGRLKSDIEGEVDQVLNELASKVLLIARRYEHTLGEIEEKAEASKASVKAALERMGYKW